MKAVALPVAVAAMFLLLAQTAQSVIIEYEGMQVKLESMKKLDELLKQSSDSNSLMKTSVSLCNHPQLPEDLQPVCEAPNPADTFKALRTIAIEDCEICVNVACTGCY